MTDARRVVIAGGSGFIGTSLAAHLSRAGWSVTVLSRCAKRHLSAPALASSLQWDARTLGPWAEALDGAAGLVNLTGRTVDCIKTPDHCDEILRSRVESTRVLGEALRRCSVPPPVWVQMSTAHIYGDPPSAQCDEDSATGYGLAPMVGLAWEEAFESSRPPSVRGVTLRTSFVVGRANAGGAGALGKLGLLARIGAGGRVGTGTQGMSWIHELDMNRLFERALSSPNIRGVYVASSPLPVSQVEFMRALRRAAGGLGRLGIGLPTAKWMVRIGAPLVLRTDPELAIYGRYVRSKRLAQEGFEFSFPEIGAALMDIYARGPGLGSKG